METLSWLIAALIAVTIYEPIIVCFYFLVGAASGYWYRGRRLKRGVIVAALFLMFPEVVAAQVKVNSIVGNTVQQVISQSFMISVSVSGGSGNPRSYVGLYPVISGVTPVRLNWKYLDDRNDPAAVALHAKAKVGPTSGTVTFDKLSAGAYEARFYRAPTELPADMVGMSKVDVGPPGIELVYYDGTATMNRTSLSSYDEVTITHSDGGIEVVRIDKAMRFILTKADAVKVDSMKVEPAKVDPIKVVP